MNDSPTGDTRRRILLALYASEDAAQQTLNHLVEQDYPLDRVSMLGKASSSGDDPLGIYYPTLGERVRAWGGMGALWGGLFGLLSGAAGMFIVPGLGPLIVAGPLAEALAGAVAGAGIGGGAMTGGAALSELSVAIHRMGVPEQRVIEIHEQLQQGHYLLLLIVDDSEVDRWRQAAGQPCCTSSRLSTFSTKHAAGNGRGGRALHAGRQSHCGGFAPSVQLLDQRAVTRPITRRRAGRRSIRPAAAMQPGFR